MTKVAPVGRGDLPLVGALHFPLTSYSNKGPFHSLYSTSFFVNPISRARACSLIPSRNQSKSILFRYDIRHFCDHAKMCGMTKRSYSCLRPERSRPRRDTGSWNGFWVVISRAGLDGLPRESLVSRTGVDIHSGGLEKSCGRHVRLPSSARHA